MISLSGYEYVDSAEVFLDGRDITVPLTNLSFNVRIPNLKSKYADIVVVKSALLVITQAGIQNLTRFNLYSDMLDSNIPIIQLQVAAANTINYITPNTIYWVKKNISGTYFTFNIKDASGTPFNPATPTRFQGSISLELEFYVKKNVDNVIG